MIPSWIANLFSIIVGKPVRQADIVDGWLTFATRVEMHPSWRYSTQTQPRAIVAHYTATDPGTAMNMAKRRTKPRAKDDRAASWHISIEADGTVIQMAPLTAQCWHAGGGLIRGAGMANRVSVGIELVGHGKTFPPAQVEAACIVWRAIVTEYGITRELAMVEHSKLDPDRRRDPGPVWMANHAPAVLDYAYERPA